MFVDRIKVFAQAGKGGRGCVSFRREKFVPKGGPDGGEGGRGGDVTLQADRHVDNLANLFYEPIIAAKKGGHGMGKKMAGRAGANKIVKVPVGTIVWLAEQATPVILSEVEGSRETASMVPPRDYSTSLGMTDGEPIVDLIRDGQQFVLCRGEGAHRGVGLGHELLRHITRCRILIFVIDVAGSEGRNPIEDLQNLRREIDLYDPALSSRPWLVVANKMDLPDAERNLRALQERFPRTKIVSTSAAQGEGIAELKETLAATMSNDKDVLSGLI